MGQACLRPPLPYKTDLPTTQIQPIHSQSVATCSILLLPFKVYKFGCCCCCLTWYGHYTWEKKMWGKNVLVRKKNFFELELHAKLCLLCSFFASQIYFYISSLCLLLLPFQKYHFQTFCDVTKEPLPRRTWEEEKFSFRVCPVGWTIYMKDVMML